MQLGNTERRVLPSRPYGRAIPQPCATDSAMSSHEISASPVLDVNFDGLTALLRRLSSQFPMRYVNLSVSLRLQKVHSRTCGRPHLSESARGLAAACHVRSQIGPVHDPTATLVSPRDGTAVTALTRRRHEGG